MADPAARAAVQEAIAAQREHFDSLALQLGYVYGDPGVPPPDVSAFEPTFRRGARLPHAWIERDGRRLSTLDLVDDKDFTLLIGSGGADWRAAARAASIPVRLLEAGLDFVDPSGEWTQRSGLPSGGALLVRPDGHVALHAETAQSAAQHLAEALARPAIFAPKPDAAAA